MGTLRYPRPRCPRPPGAFFLSCQRQSPLVEPVETDACPQESSGGVRRDTPGTGEEKTTTRLNQELKAMTEQSQPEKVHGDPVDSAADREVAAGDVAEDPHAQTQG